MRRIAWGLLLVFAFAIPWEYSLDLSEPLGNVARIAGVLLVLVGIPAVLQAGRLRTPGPMQWLVLAFYLWFCCSYFWTVDPDETLTRLRGFFQEMMTVWLVWEFAETPSDLQNLLRAYVAGSWVLALLTLSNFSSPEAIAAGQFRFVAEGQDPNDVARYLDLGFPLAALLLNCEPRWPARLLALGYLPLGLVAVVLTASRGGFLAAVVALAGCGILLARNHARGVLAGTLALPGIAVALWFFVPHETFERLATIPGQLQGGDLNQRMNIWTFGWQAFAHTPLLGSGAGTFVSASRIASMNTAHNTALSIIVTGGLIALCLFTAIVALALRSILRTHGPLQLAFATALGVWFITTLDATVEENRTTWLLLALIALGGRLAVEAPQRLAACFAAHARRPETAMPTVPNGWAKRLAD